MIVPHGKRKKNACRVALMFPISIVVGNPNILEYQLDLNITVHGLRAFCLIFMLPVSCFAFIGKNYWT